jgi:hypothetical protein
MRRRPTRPDAFSLVAGLVIVVFGTVLLFERTGKLDLNFGVLAPIAFAAVGAVLLASGLTRRG